MTISLTGSIPSLAGLSTLIYFYVNNNLLSGTIPAVPSPTNALVPGDSSLCPNHLTLSTDSAWDTATGSTPWSAACTTLPSQTVTPSAGGNGGISPNTAQTIAYGMQTSFTVTPAAGYSASVGGTCGGSLNGTTYTTTFITYNCMVEATFNLIPVATPAVAAPMLSGYAWPALIAGLFAVGLFTLGRQRAGRTRD